MTFHPDPVLSHDTASLYEWTAIPFPAERYTKLSETLHRWVFNSTMPFPLADWTLQFRMVTSLQS